jgi:hypothetical protein
VLCQRHLASLKYLKGFIFTQASLSHAITTENACFEIDRAGQLPSAGNQQWLRQTKVINTSRERSLRGNCMNCNEVQHIILVNNDITT